MSDTQPFFFLKSFTVWVLTVGDSISSFPVHGPWGIKTLPSLVFADVRGEMLRDANGGVNLLLSLPSSTRITSFTRRKGDRVRMLQGDT